MLLQKLVWTFTKEMYYVIVKWVNIKKKVYCGDMQFKVSRSTFTVLFRFVASSWKFPRLYVLLLLSNMKSIIGGFRLFFIFIIWMFLWWLQVSLLFCNSVSESLVWTLTINLGVHSRILLIILFDFLEQNIYIRGQ